MKQQRVAVVVSNPIQHFCPQYVSWSRLPEVDLRVFFASSHGMKPYHDVGFGRVVQWPGISVDFPHEFLDGGAERELGQSIDAPSLGDRLREFAPDVIVVYGYSQPLQRRALMSARLARVPVIMVADSELRSARPLGRRAVKALALPLLYRQVAAFLTVGDANEAYYRSYGVPDDRMVRCFFPIDVTRYDAALADRDAARARIRARHAIPDGDPVTLTVGKLMSTKRQADLVALSNRVRDRSLTVILAGTGPDEAALRAAARAEGSGGVVFAGFVPPDELIAYYCAADVYIHASRLEPHSLAISEAIYCGLPVVVSDRCGSYGPTDDVRNGLNGRVYRCGDLDQLDTAVSDVLAEPPRWRAMSEASTRISRANQALAHGAALRQALDVVAFQRRSA